MDYNTERDRLKIADYGRNVAEMIEYAKTVEDRERRTAVAEVIVAIMARVNPKVTQTADYKHILWNHLMEMADYGLDVDCPYELAGGREGMKPRQIGYSARNLKSRQYGRVVERLVDCALGCENEEDRNELTMRVGGYMKRLQKRCYGSDVSDGEIAEHIALLSEGRLRLPEGTVLLEGEQLESCAADDAQGGKKKRKRKKKKNQRS